MADTYSVLITLRRTTVEYGHVSVPVTDAVIDSETRRLDGEAVFQEALKLGDGADIEWIMESEPVIEVNPIQRPREDASLQ